MAAEREKGGAKKEKKKKKKKGERQFSKKKSLGPEMPGKSWEGEGTHVGPCESTRGGKGKEILLRGREPQKKVSGKGEAYVGKKKSCYVYEGSRRPLKRKEIARGGGVQKRKRERGGCPQKRYPLPTRG